MSPTLGAIPYFQAQQGVFGWWDTSTLHLHIMACIFSYQNGFHSHGKSDSDSLLCLDALHLFLNFRIIRKKGSNLAYWAQIATKDRVTVQSRIKIAQASQGFDTQTAATAF